MGADLKLLQTSFEISFQGHIRIIAFFVGVASDCWKSNSRQPMKDFLPTIVTFGRRLNFEQLIKAISHLSLKLQSYYYFSIIIICSGSRALYYFERKMILEQLALLSLIAFQFWPYESDRAVVWFKYLLSCFLTHFRTFPQNLLLLILELRYHFFHPSLNL